MPFLVGDDNGGVKRIQNSKNTEGDIKLSAGEDLTAGLKGKQRAIQTMALGVEDKMASLHLTPIFILIRIQKDSRFSCRWVIVLILARGRWESG